MGVGRNFRAAQVVRKARDFAASRIAKPGPGQAPAWLAAVESIPPSEILTRPYPIQHTEPKKRARRPSHNLFRPTQIVYPEDELRQNFYRDHPWELARPKMVLEMDGKDARYRDWSKGIRQPGMALSGECVVQRQLYLMENHGLTKAQAYDVSRKEFYKLRQREEIENRIAVEEARMVGAYFDKNILEHSLDAEDLAFEGWKAWATGNIEKFNAEKDKEITDSGEIPDTVAAGLEEELPAVAEI
ncbi:mitochondrial ribosomal protein S25 [Apodospora peruviana]|uniref:37S ribosomal protein S25, mitochondrial n=1 Tax=Apodospora peruviana TaxID=516989 RepID=A0AAE0HXG3_9PEZI|nr:mitochondrial ribosomal protein S25 [Apodospora peruviana]